MILAIEPTFDANGYPTEETLQVIEKWPIASTEDLESLLAYVERAWQYRDWGWRRSKRRTRERYKGAALRRLYNISTGGWSGNESLIRALEANFLFWLLCFVQHRRGGHYIFEVREGLG